MPALRIFEQRSNKKVSNLYLEGTKGIEIFIFLNYIDNDDYYVDESWVNLKDWYTGGYETANFILPFGYFDNV